MKVDAWVVAVVCCVAALSACKQPCAADSDCDDQNACTQDHCAAGTCSHQGVVVDDLNACTVDSCDPVKGIQRTPVNVDDGDSCTQDWCEPTAGVQHQRVFTSVCAATQLGFRDPLVAGEVAQAFVPPIAVEIRAADGGVVTLSSAAVTLALAPNDAGALLAGTVSLSATNGVASFPAVHVDVPAQGLVLVASSPGLTPATSSAFNVYPPCVTGLTRNGSGNCVDFCSTGVNTTASQAERS